jgi:hypothetical protein
MIQNENFNDHLNGFYQYLISLLNNYSDLVSVLKQELECILSGDIVLLGENLRKQQVLLIGTKDFDKKVSDYSLNLNIYANNLTELTLQLPKQDQYRFFRLLDDFDKVVEQVTFYKNECQVLLQGKLYTIDKALSRLDVQKDKPTYDKNATEVQGGKHLKSFERSV